MSTTQENPSPTGGPSADPGPAFNRDRIHNLDQMRLSSEDRYLAGVAGGVGRHFGIDPIVVRVVLAALCVFGGIGLMLYAVLWIFVPSDRTNRAIIDLNGPTRRTILLLFAGIAGLGVIGSVVGGFGGLGGHFAWPLAAIVGVCAVALAYLRPENYRTHRSTAATGLDTPSSSGHSTSDLPPSAPVPPTPAFTPPAVPPRPRRTGLILFWPTLATIIVAFGILGIVAVNHSVAALWWPGTALAIIGAALLIGAFAGRPGGLIPLGLLMIPGIVISTVLGTGSWRHQDLNYSPTSAAAVSSSYHLGTGQAKLDLSGVRDPSALAGRTIKVSMTAGEIDVTLPPGITTDIKASLEVAGDVQIDGNDHGGFNPNIHQTLGAGSTAPLHLVLNGRIGYIQVTTTKG